MAFLGVALGAFGAHGLKATLGDMKPVYETGVLYHLVHAVAILLVGLLSERAPDARWNVVAWLFLAGIILFSGSLYLMAITKVSALGFVTPFGGVCFLAGWAYLAVLSGPKSAPHGD